VSQSWERGAPGLGPARALRAVSLCFFLNGAVIASWVPHIPDVKTRLAVGDGGLGLLLLSLAVGAVASEAITCTQEATHA